MRDRVPAKYRETAPHVMEADGREYWVYEGERQTTMGLNAVAGKPREQWGMEPARFADMIPGCYDPVERAKDMRSDGIFASVNFPTLPGFGGRKFIGFSDKDLAKVCVEAWNDFVLDEWCGNGHHAQTVPGAPFRRLGRRRAAVHNLLPVRRGSDEAVRRSEVESAAELERK